MQQKAIKDNVIALVEAHDMLPAEGRVPVVLMVSGGSDSVALARLLPALYPQHPYTILHINHQLRAEAAEKDELFVVHLAQELGLPCEVRRIDIGVLAAKTGDNLEQAGRTARYAEANTLLDKLCEQAGVDLSQGRIVTAHTLDDRVETFFMRTIVGGGVVGLSSIPQVNGRVIRPLLGCTREELQTYANFWREDATNEDTSKLRAFVRHELIPLAKTRNPELLHTVERTLDVLGGESALVEQLAQAATGRFVREGDDALLRIDTRLFEEDPVLVRRVIREACNRVLPAGERITYEHIVAIAQGGNRVGFVTDIPGAVTVANEYGTLVFRRLAAADNRVSDTWELELDEGARRQLPDGRVIVLARVEPQLFAGDAVGFAKAHASASQVFIDGEAFERAGGRLVVRGLAAGDRVCPLGMKGQHKLVSDVLVDRKIVQRRRAEVLKVCAFGGENGGAENSESTKNAENGEIVWIIDVCLDDRYKVSAETSSMFSIIVSGPELA